MVLTSTSQHSTDSVQGVDFCIVFRLNEKKTHSQIFTKDWTCSMSLAKIFSFRIESVCWWWWWLGKKRCNAFICRWAFRQRTTFFSLSPNKCRDTESQMKAQLINYMRRFYNFTHALNSSYFCQLGFCGSLFTFWHNEMKFAAFCFSGDTHTIQTCLTISDSFLMFVCVFSLSSHCCSSSSNLFQSVRMFKLHTLIFN